MIPTCIIHDIMMIGLSRGVQQIRTSRPPRYLGSLQVRFSGGGNAKKKQPYTLFDAHDTKPVPTKADDKPSVSSLIFEDIESLNHTPHDHRIIKNMANEMSSKSKVSKRKPPAAFPKNFVRMQVARSMVADRDKNTRIVRVGHPAMNTTCQAVPLDTFHNPKFLKSIDDLVKMMQETKAFGLSMPQIGVPVRVFAMELKEETFKEFLDQCTTALFMKPENAKTYADTSPKELAKNLKMEPYELEILINPEVVKVSKETATFRETCESIPGLSALVERPLEIEVSAYDLEGEPFTKTFKGWQARCALHEIDHLNGILYTARMDPKSVSHEEESNYYDFYS